MADMVSVGADIPSVGGNFRPVNMEYVISFRSIDAVSVQEDGRLREAVPTITFEMSTGKNIDWRFAASADRDAAYALLYDEYVDVIGEAE